MNKFLSILVLLLPLSGYSGLSKLSSTVYYIQAIDLDQDCAVKKTILDTSGLPIFKVCKQNYNSCVIEGTCAIVDDDNNEIVETTFAKSDASDMQNNDDIKLLNYVREDKKGNPLFEHVDTDRCPYGLGVGNICLDPYYSVAADLKYNKAGDVIYVPKLSGLPLLNGEKHSGFMIVRDRGGAIKGANRFDFYTGFNRSVNDANPFTDIGLARSTNTFEYRKATADEALAFKKSRNYPNIPTSVFKTN